MPSKGAVGVSGLPHEEPPFGYLGASREGAGGGGGGARYRISMLVFCQLGLDVGEMQDALVR